MFGKIPGPILQFPCWISTVKSGTERIKVKHYTEPGGSEEPGGIDDVIYELCDANALKWPMKLEH